MEPTTKARFNWRLPCYGAILGLIVLLPVILESPDSCLVLILVAVPIIGLVLAIAAIVWSGRRLALFAMFAAYCLVILGMLVNYRSLREIGRWFLWSKSYKSEVLAQSTNPLAKELKHIEWDGWGWAGSDTTEYVLFDPSDKLAVPAEQHLSGRFEGIPCGVYRIRRMENHWYMVLFYTDTTWDQCN
jgi:hypothetical protein